MPLRFDPSALLAQGGVMHGLDDMGSAVINALNNRANRKYQEQREATQRGQQVSDREQAYARALSQHQEDQKRKGWFDAAAAGTPDEVLGDENPYEGADPATLEQLYRIRQGKIADRAARQLQVGGPGVIAPPPRSVGVKEQATDEYAEPIKGKFITVDQPVDFPTRVGQAEKTAAELAKFKGRGADAAANLEYARGGREALDTINEHAFPWNPEGSGVNKYASDAVAAFNAGETLPAGARDAALLEDAQLTEAVALRDKSPLLGSAVDLARQHAAKGKTALRALITGSKPLSHLDAATIDRILFAAGVPDDGAPEDAATTGAAPVTE
jgi:hypothetical protein